MLFGLTNNFIDIYGNSSKRVKIILWCIENENINIQ